MNCQALITNFIIDYVEGVLPPDTRAEFERHLEVCVSCVEYLRSYRESVAMAAQAERAPRLPVEDVPPELVEAILASVRR
jgi:anti-sigma factor RsiW